MNNIIMNTIEINAKLQLIFNSVSLSSYQKKLITDVVTDIISNINTDKCDITKNNNDNKINKELSEIESLDEDATIEDVIYNFNHLLSILKQNY